MTMEISSKVWKKKPLFLMMIGLIWLASILVFAKFANKFANFGAQARQSEAKNQLMHIYTLQTSFFIDHGRFGSIAGGGCEPNEIGFSQNCESARYEYRMTLIDGSKFIATARERVRGGVRTVFPQCGDELDEWKIDEQRQLESVHDVAKNCRDSKSAIFSLPPLNFLGVGLVVCCLLCLFFCLIELVSSVFLPPGASKVRLALKLSVVSLPWITLSVFLTKLSSAPDSLNVSLLIASITLIVLGLGLIFSRWIVIRDLVMTQGRRLAIVFLVPGAIALISVLLFLVPLYCH